MPLHYSLSLALQPCSSLLSLLLICIITTTVQWTVLCCVFSLHYTFLLLFGCVLFNVASFMPLSFYVKKSGLFLSANQGIYYLAAFLYQVKSLGLLLFLDKLIIPGYPKIRLCVTGNVSFLLCLCSFKMNGSVRTLTSDSQNFTAISEHLALI